MLCQPHLRWAQNKLAPYFSPCDDLGNLPPQPPSVPIHLASQQSFLTFTLTKVTLGKKASLPIFLYNDMGEKLL